MELNDWLAAVSRELGVDDVALDPDAIRILLELARDSAHEVERVAAPLTTFLAGVAVGRGQQLGRVAKKATALALSITPTSGDDAPTAG